MNVQMNTVFELPKLDRKRNYFQGNMTIICSLMTSMSKSVFITFLVALITMTAKGGDTELDYDDPSLSYGSLGCNDTVDCPDRNFICDDETEICRCDDGFIELDHCFPYEQWGEVCVLSAQCNETDPNTYCDQYSRSCECLPGYYYNDGCIVWTYNDEFEDEEEFEDEF